MYISDHILYVGVNDTDIDLFEGQYKVPHGMSYNSYIIKDEKTAVFDTVDARKGDEWLSNISAVLGGKRPDYLIIQHMEPDHSASIARFLEAYPDTCVVGNAKTFAIAEKFFGRWCIGRRSWSRTRKARRYCFQPTHSEGSGRLMQK